MRRQARGRALRLEVGPGGVPRCLAVVPCIEVWAAAGVMPPRWSAYPGGPPPVPRGCKVSGSMTVPRLLRGGGGSGGVVGRLPHWPGQAARVAEILVAAGATLADLPTLRREASRLLEELGPHVS